jgi:hypothetical protein
MELVRILHPDEYEPQKKRFRSTAFEPYVDMGDISVFEENCAVVASGSICRHVEVFYPETVPGGTPPQAFYLWRFAKTALPTGCAVNQKTSDSGDGCHYNISGLTKKAAMKWFKDSHCNQPAETFSGIWKCNGAGPSSVAGPTFI